MQPNKWVVDERWVWLDQRWDVDGQTGCWNWTGPRWTNGYGLANVPKSINRYKRDRAHRIAWRIAHAGAPIPVGQFVCHRCDNPPCVNPDHLFLATCQENTDDAYAKGRRGPGIMNPAAVLGEDAVREIRKLVALGAHRRDLARRYAVSPATIHHIVTRRSWGHIA